MKSQLRILAVLIVISTFSNLQAQTPSHADSFSKQGLLKANVAQLKDTELVAHPDAPLDATKNVLWCGTLQLAWNEAIGLVGEKLRFANEPPLVGLLNQEDFTRADLDAASYVAIADFERNHVEDEIRAALEKTFGGAASPELIPPIPTNPHPQDFLAYAYLYKKLAFRQAFEDKKPFAFGDTQVKNFGFTNERSEIRKDRVAQVTLCYYDSPDNFIIKVKTKSPEDELILAKIPTSSTLQAAMNYVVDRTTNAKPIEIGFDDVLSVPKLNFDLRGDFPQLENLVLQPSRHARVNNLKTTSVKQLVRFQLNENGAILKSEAVMGFVGAVAMPTPPKIHTMIFDRPFLILMKQTGSPMPYFALWVGNASLLMPASVSASPK